MNRKSMQTLLVVLVLVLLGAPSSGQAQTCDGISPDKFPCGYAIADLAVQRVPALFKLQARVAQAKLPVGEGTFATVVVKLVRGSEVLCLESFGNVQVKESVLNLEIGRNMSCELDEYIAKNEDLAFQVCLGGADNCLKPVALAATPYAVKSTYAVHATDAMKATAAAQANYAYRVTADRDLIATRQVGTGYFDFYSPGSDAGGPTCTASWLAGNPVCDPDAGYVQWTPVRAPDALDLTVAGKKNGTDQMVELHNLVLASEATTATGDLTVTPDAAGQGLTVTARGAHVTGDSDVTGELTVSDRTTVLADGIHVTGASDVFGTLQVSEATTVASGGIHVTGASDITGATSVTGTLGVSEATTVASGGIHVTGASDITGATTVTGTLGVSQATTVSAGGIHVTGVSDIVGDTTIDGTLDVAAGAHVTGDSTLLGAWSVTGDSSFVGSVGVQGPVTVDGLMDAQRGLTVTGEMADGYAADVLGGLHVTAGARVDGRLAVHAAPDDAEADLTYDVDSGLMVVTGGVHANGDSSVFGTLSVQADPTAEQFALEIDGGGINVNRSDVVVDGSVVITNGALFVGATNSLTSDADAGKMVVSGPVTFTSPVVFQGGSSETNSAYVLREGESRPVSLTSTLGVTGQLSALGGLVATGAFSVVTAAPAAVGLAYNTVDGLRVLLGGLHVSSASDFAGKVTVSAGGVAVTGASIFNGLLSAAAGLAVTGTSSFAGKLSITTGGLAVTGTSGFSDKLTVSANGVDVTGPSTFRNAVTVTGGGVAVTGASSVAGKLTVSSGGMAVTGTSSLSDKLTVAANGVDVTGASTFRNALTVAAGGLAVTGASSVAGKLTVSANGVDVTGASTFRNAVNVATGGLVIGAGGLAVKGATTADDVTVSGLLDVGYAVVTCASTDTCPCPIGKLALGGGVGCASNNHHVHSSYPLVGGSGWFGTCENSVGTNQTPANIYAVCARVK